MKDWKINSRHCGTGFDFAEKEKQIKKLEEKASRPDFWGMPEEAQKISEELADLKNEIDFWNKLEKELLELTELLKLSEQKPDEKFISQIEERYKELESKFKKEEFKIFLSGKYDKNNAILLIHSGAGGIDAQDWASMLLRMYERYVSKRDFKVKTIHHSFGEEGGTKSATMSVEGKYAYGYLKKEAGVHRLVRISPFSAQKLRHTSFALVEVLPEIEEKEIEINPKDIKIDFYRATGPGGQNVNKTETAVRITHLPTGIVVNCQNERSQAQNKERAIKVLSSKLYLYKKEQEEKEREKLKGKHISPAWGNQIRSYVLHPYKMVKDLRTKIETSDAEGVLNGNLDEFIEAELKGLAQKFES